VLQSLVNRCRNCNAPASAELCAQCEQDRVIERAQIETIKDETQA